MGRKIVQTEDFVAPAKITGLPQATAAGEPVTYDQWQAQLEGLAFKDNVRVSTQGNINLAAPGASIDGITMVLNDRFIARSQTSQPENGIYIWNGAGSPATRAPDASTFDELESAIVTVDEGTDAGKSFRQTQVNGVIGTNNVVWTGFGTGASQATETLAGIAEIATQAETDAGTDDQRIVSPLKLKTSSFASRGGSLVIGDGSATQFDITHNLGSRNVLVAVFRNSSPWDDVVTDVERPDANTVRVRFASAPSNNQYVIVVQKIGG